MGQLLAYTPFLDPAPVWNIWMALLLPLTIGLSIAYKSMKCREMSKVPREAASIAVMILLGMAAAAALLWIIVRIMELTV